MFFVMYRSEDAPHTAAFNQQQFDEWLNEIGDNYRFLTEPPDIESFPSNSAFVVKGVIFTP